MASANLIFARYKIVKLIIQVRPLLGQTTNTVFGILDDVINSAATLPTTFNDVYQLRCSAIISPGQTVPTIFEWKPVDPDKWYYTEGDIGGDNRFTVPAGLVAFSSSGTVLPVEFHYTIEFEGATDTS